MASKTATALTAHEGSAVRFPRAAANGSVVAYEFEDAIWTVPPAGGPPTRLSIQVPADQVKNPIERRTATDDADELAISPDGKLAAFIVHGDVFVTAIVDKDDQEIAKPPTARVTTTPERERDLSWSPDGSHPALLLRRRRQRRSLYRGPGSRKTPPGPRPSSSNLTRVTDTPAEEYAASFSPDGEKIAFIRGQGQLIVQPATGGDETVILDHWAAPDYEWSPDGAWIAYSTPDEHYNSEVWIVPSAGGDRYNVSRHPDDDVAPRWSPDGRRLVWTAKRADNTFDLWGVWLTREDDERTPAQWLKLWNDKDKDKKKGTRTTTRQPEDDEKKPELPTVSIDFDRLWERVHRITDLKGDEGAARVSPDGKTIIFTAEFEGDDRPLQRALGRRGPQAPDQGRRRARAVRLRLQGQDHLLSRRQGPDQEGRSRRQERRPRSPSRRAMWSMSGSSGRWSSTRRGGPSTRTSTIPISTASTGRRSR